MKSLNKALLIGHVGKDPELRYTTSGVAVATFSLATNESWKNSDGEQQERTEWHNIVAWRKLAEIVAEYVQKGMRVYIEGRIETRSYEHEGVKKYRTQVVADSLIMLSGGGVKRNEEEETATTSESSGASHTDDDDLPF